MSGTHSIYYACEDPANPVCRDFVNQGSCRRDSRCRFYHPPIITTIIRRKATRDIGCCYCGAAQKRVINKRPFRIGEDGSIPIFYVVCSRTRRSMRSCM